MNDGSTSATLKPLSRSAGYALVGLYSAWIGFTVFRHPGAGYHLLWFLFFMGLIGIVLFMLADILVAEVRLDESGIRRTGLFNREKRLAWDKVLKIKLHKGRGRYRDIRLGSRRDKMAFSNMHRDFWPMAHAILKAADQRGIPVKTSILCSRESWLAAQEVK